MRSVPGIARLTLVAVIFGVLLYSGCNGDKETCYSITVTAEPAEGGAVAFKTDSGGDVDLDCVPPESTLQAIATPSLGDDLEDPSDDWEFERWGEDLAGTDNPISFTVDEDMTIKAYFKR